jgi:hypothetical protein
MMRTKKQRELDRIIKELAKPDFLYNIALFSIGCWVTGQMLRIMEWQAFENRQYWQSVEAPQPMG